MKMQVASLGGWPGQKKEAERTWCLGNQPQHIKKDLQQGVTFCTAVEVAVSTNWPIRMRLVGPKDRQVRQFSRAAVIQSLPSTGKRAVASLQQCSGVNSVVEVRFNKSTDVTKEEDLEGSAVRLAGSEVHWTVFTTC